MIDIIWLFHKLKVGVLVGTKSKNSVVNFVVILEFLSIIPLLNMELRAGVAP